MHLLLFLLGAAHAAELDFTLLTASCSATPWFGSTCLDYTVGGGADTVGVCTYDDADDAPTEGLYIAGSTTTSPNWIALPAKVLPLYSGVVSAEVSGFSNSCSTTLRGQVEFRSAEGAVVGTEEIGPVSIGCDTFSEAVAVTVPAGAATYRARAGFTGGGATVSDFAATPYAWDHGCGDYPAPDCQCELGQNPRIYGCSPRPPRPPPGLACTIYCPDASEITGTKVDDMCVPPRGTDCPDSDGDDTNTGTSPLPTPTDPFPQCPT